jgi:hypothetical protein
MSSPELLSLLCAGTCRYHPALGEGSAVGQLGRLEIAGLLRGLSTEAMNLALAKYCADLEAERMLIAQVRVWAVGLALKESWPVLRGKPVITNMAAFACLETVRPNRCGTCKGTGFKGARICPACNGVGVAKLPDMAIASACGLEKSVYSRRWRSRYEVIYRHVADLDGQVLGVLRRQKDIA